MGAACQCSCVLASVLVQCACACELASASASAVHCAREEAGKLLSALLGQRSLLCKAQYISWAALHKSQPA